ncbi:30S ribosomal protein S8 [Patescibacteria group bacterium]|nr:30S ribosomal protein S8 [Patescibacteria group bacterium]
MSTDPISDFLTRIRNAQAARHETVVLPSSKIKFSMAKILEREGYIEEVRLSTEGAKRSIEFRLKYDGRTPVIRHLSRVSTPGCRVYCKSTELPRVLSGQGIAIVSTSAGVMTNREARKRKLGGEVLCEIY